jgi:hypothetical protein
MAYSAIEKIANRLDEFCRPVSKNCLTVDTGISNLLRSPKNPNKYFILSANHTRHGSRVAGWRNP